MTIRDGYAAATVNGEVIYEQAFTAIIAPGLPGLGIESPATVVWRETPTAPKPRTAKAKREDAQLTLF